MFAVRHVATIARGRARLGSRALSTTGSTCCATVAAGGAHLSMLRAWAPEEGPAARLGTPLDVLTTLGDATNDTVRTSMLRELTAKWATRRDVSEIAGMYEECVECLAGNGVTSAWAVARFVDTRFAAQERLSARQAGVGVPDMTPGVLFLCGHNAGRSQMCAAWATHYAGDAIASFSGGSTPVAHVNPVVMDAMADVGVDMSVCFPKPWTPEVAESVDTVITMGCGDKCPVVPSQERITWNLTDPAGQEMDVVAVVRDECKMEVLQLLRSLDVQPSQLHTCPVRAQEFFD